MISKYIRIAFWSLFTGVVLFGMYSAGEAQYASKAGKPEIMIRVSGENSFLTENEIRLRLERQGLIYPDQLIRALPVSQIEKSLINMSEIRKAHVYRTIGGGWYVDVELRKPIARIFNREGESYYLDDLGHQMAVSSAHAARVLVVTGNIPDPKNGPPVDTIINIDTLKTKYFLDDIYRISHYVCTDPFLSAQISQIHRKPNGDFILIPQVGDQLIVFGTANSKRDVADKFRKLKLFYQEGLPYEGWDKYSEINLKFDRQIVCKKKEEL